MSEWEAAVYTESSAQPLWWPRGWGREGGRVVLVFLNLYRSEGFPGGSDDKASARNAGDLGSIPGLGRSPGGGNGNPLQYSCLENPMDGGAWWATVHGVSKSQSWLSDFTSLIVVTRKVTWVWRFFVFVFYRGERCLIAHSVYLMNRGQRAI